MQAFGHQLDSNQMDDAQPDAAFAASRYSPVSGRADRLAANIPGDTSSWGGNGYHLVGGGGGTNGV